MQYHTFIPADSQGNCCACAEPIENHGTRPTVLAAPGSTFDMGAGLLLTIRPRCKGTNRRERSEYALGRTDRAEIVFSHCKRHGAEPVAADDMAAVR